MISQEQHFKTITIQTIFEMHNCIAKTWGVANLHQRADIALSDL